jgi:antitoxin component YwqK of YwqJK toxin-antitoxin module
MKASTAIFISLFAVTALRAADDDADKQFAKLRSSIPFQAYEARYPNGQIKERGRMRFLGYVCGREWTDYDGLFEGWYASGTKECEILYKNGDRDGVSLNWFPNGNKKYIVTWSKGKRDGDFTVFYDSEVVSAKGRFTEEIVAQVEFFDQAGKRITRDHWLQIPGNRSFWQ